MEESQVRSLFQPLSSPLPMEAFLIVPARARALLDQVEAEAGGRVGQVGLGVRVSPPSSSSHDRIDEHSTTTKIPPLIPPHLPRCSMTEDDAEEEEEDNIGEIAEGEEEEKAAAAKVDDNIGVTISMHSSKASVIPGIHALPALEGTHRLDCSALSSTVSVAIPSSTLSDTAAATAATSVFARASPPLDDDMRLFQQRFKAPIGVDASDIFLQKLWYIVRYANTATLPGYERRMPGLAYVRASCLILWNRLQLLQQQLQKTLSMREIKESAGSLHLFTYINEFQYPDI